MNFLSSIFTLSVSDSHSHLSASVPAWAWIIFIVFIVTMLALDLGVFHKKDKAVPFKEAVLWSFIWVGLACVACLLIGLWHDEQVAELFAMGYLLELSLSVDNLFVFLIIFSFFKIPEKYMHRVLFWGILGAVFFRAIFIFGGIALVTKFSWVMYIFGALLIYTGVKMFFPEKENVDLATNPMVKLAAKTGRFAPTFHGHDFFFLKDGLIFATPLFLVLLVIELSDVMFAIDSVPAILGIIPKNCSQEMKMFIAFTSNIFAILGLRSFFFALSGFMKMLRFLRLGLGFILTFIGIKLLVSELGTVFPVLEGWHPSTKVSLSVLIGILLVSVALSMAFPKKKEKTHD